MSDFLEEGRVYSKAKIDQMLANLGAGGASGPGVHVPGTWGEHWRTALASAKAGTGKAKVAVIGDSIGSLFYASTPATSWVGLTRTALQAFAGDGGSGWVGSALSQLVSGAYGNNSMYPTTFTGAWTYFAHRDGPGMVNAYTSTPGDKVTTLVRGSSIKVYTTGNAAGVPVSIKVDGGSTQSFVTGAQFVVTEHQLAGVAEGPHTVEVSAPAGVDGGHSLFFYGVAAENAHGVVVDNYSMSATASGQWAADGDMPTGNVPARWCGGAARPADLLVYSVGVNDAAGIVANYSALTADAYLDNVDRTIAKALAGRGANVPDVLFFLPPIGAWQDTGAKWSQMIERLTGYAIARGYGLTLMDPVLKNSREYGLSVNFWGNGTPGATGSDPVHPSDEGHELMADTITPVMLP